MSKKWLIPSLFFALVTAYFLFGLCSDMTWMSIGADQMNYVIAAKYNAPAGLSGNPLYILLGSLLLKLPGNPFWLLGLLSALPAVGTAIVVWFTVKRFTKHPYAPYIAALAFASAFPVWAESVIAETYMITVFVSSLVMYFCFTKRYYWMAIMMALGVGLHPLGMWITFPCLVYAWWVEGKDFKLAGKVAGISILGLVFRLRDVFTTPATQNLFYTQNPYENLLYSAGGYFGMAVWPIQTTLQRFFEDFCALGTCLPSIVIAAFTFVKRRGIILLWIIFGLAFFFPFASLYPQWIKYMVIPVLPLSLLVGLGIERLDWTRAKSLVLLIPLVTFLIVNFVAYSPGKGIDPVPTTARQFYNQLSSIPEGSIILGHTWGHPDLVVLYYGVEHNDSLRYVNYDAIKYEYDQSLGQTRKYLDKIEKTGLTVPEILGDYGYSDNVGHVATISQYAQALQYWNPDREVYVTYVKSSEIPMEFGLVPASDYNSSINNLPGSKNQFSGE